VISGLWTGTKNLPGMLTIEANYALASDGSKTFIWPKLIHPPAYFMLGCADELRSHHNPSLRVTTRRHQTGRHDYLVLVISIVGCLDLNSARHRRTPQ